MRLGSVNYLIEYYTDQCSQTELSVEGCHQSADISTGGSCLSPYPFLDYSLLVESEIVFLKVKISLVFTNNNWKLKAYWMDLIVIIIEVTKPITVWVFIK